MLNVLWFALYAFNSTFLLINLNFMIVYFTYFLLFLMSYQVAATAFHMKLNNTTTAW